MAVAHVDPDQPDVEQPKRKGARRGRVENQHEMLRHLAAELGIAVRDVRRHLPVFRPELAERPLTRGHCVDVPRPCPYVACPHNLYLEVSDETGNIQRTFADRQPGEMEWSCSLDEAARHGLTLEEVSRRLGVTRERVRQIEERALRKIARATGADLILGPMRRRGLIAPAD
jgi:hypothetical protein